MDEEGRKLVRRLLEEGQRYDDVRRAIISHGYSTERFEDEYHEIQKELGIAEPKPKPVAFSAFNSVVQSEVETDDDADVEDEQRTRLMTNVMRLLAGAVVLVGATLLFSGYGSQIKETFFVSTNDEAGDGLTATDLTHETQLRSMRLSAGAYRSKILDYGGLCESIGIDRSTYNCVENVKHYAIEAKLSTGSYFCVDDTGFVGVVTQSHRGNPKCVE